MIKKYFTISIIREARADENRTPFTPRQTQALIAKFSNLNILVQPSPNRCFKDENYLKAGAKIEENISHSDIIFGVKEIEISKLIENKTYLFFSHTSKVRQYINKATQDKAIIYKKELLKDFKPILSEHFNINAELALKAISRGYKYKVVPISWFNRKKNISKFKIKEMQNRYIFTILYVWIEKILLRRDIRKS